MRAYNFPDIFYVEIKLPYFELHTEVYCKSEHIMTRNFLVWYCKWFKWKFTFGFGKTYKAYVAEERKKDNWGNLNATKD
jgi:hypothetical protein